MNKNYFAVVIGNEIYTNEIKVKYAANDAKVVYKYFSSTIGIPSENIRYLENATFGQMWNEITWLNSVTKAYHGNVKLFFYYAGHGVPNEQSKNAYLLPSDGNASLSQTSVLLDDLYSKLTEHKPQIATVFIDACFSGGARDGMLVEARGVKIKPKLDVMNGNIVVFSAASNDETAYPYDDKKHGLFTYFMLKKLKDTKGELSYQELSEYLTNNVSQTSIVRNNKTQTPTVFTSNEFMNNWKILKIK